MSKSIKEMHPEQHIIFTTAHSESHYFLDAIEMQVDGYIIKPIDYDLLENKISQIKTHIALKQKLKEQEKLTNEITRLQDNLLFVLDKDQQEIFLNEKFLDFFEVKDIKAFNKKCKNISDFFIQSSGCFYPKPNRNWIEDMRKTLNEKRRLIALKDKHQILHNFILSFKDIEESGHSIFILTEITHLTMEKMRLKEEAYKDRLTQVPNRAYFEKHFEKEVQRQEKEDSSTSLIILDIDKFKNFNDTYGHQVGDKILRELANLIHKNKRESDIFARWGGEEFVLLLPNTILNDAQKVAQKLRLLIETQIFHNNLRLTCSFGVSQFTHGDTESSLLEKADTALYKAKHNGRNRVETT